MVQKKLTSIPIERGGGKLEVTKKLAEEGFPVPKSEYLYYPDLDNKAAVLQAFENLRKPVIVRGSHPNDWDGYVDVLPTERNVYDEESLLEAISEIKRVAASDDLRVHATDWGQLFSPEVHVLLQEQSTSPLVGSVLRHPHVKDRVDVNYINATKRGEDIHTLIRKNADGNIDHEGFDMWHGPRKQIEEIFAHYEDVENSGLFDKSFTYQVEIGLNPFMIYQVRPFKKLEPVAEFKLPECNGVSYPVIDSDLVFGITPKDGIGIRLEPMSYRSLYIFGPETKSEPYGIIIEDYPHCSLPTKIKMNDLVAYVTASPSFRYLEHGDYRQIKRAKISLVEYNYDNITSLNKYGETLRDFDRFRDSKIWSNGDSAVIIPAEEADKRGL